MHRPGQGGELQTTGYHDKLNVTKNPRGNRGVTTIVIIIIIIIRI